MRKHNLFRYCLLLLMAAIGLTASAADAGVIYLVDWGRNGGAPLKDNENQFTKLYETEPRSRIYVGIHDFLTSNWFRFYSELQDGPEVNWKLNNICPLGDTVLPQIGKSGIYFDTNVHDTKRLAPVEESGTWSVPVAGKYQVSVDLNAGTLELIPTDDYLVLFNETSVPDASTYANYPSLFTLNKYVEPGDVKLYFYSPYSKAWICPDYPGIQSSYYSYYVNAYGHENATSGTPVEINNWPGGIMSGRSTSYTISLEPDGGWNPGFLSGEKIYLVGDATGWQFDEYFSFPAANEAGTIFNVTIPAGMSMFKFTLSPQWDGTDFGADRVTKNDAGEFVVSLVSGGNNFTFNSPLEAPLSGVLNLDEWTLTLPASAPLTVSPNYDPDYSDYLFISTPDDEFELWDSAPLSISRQFDRLRKTGENEWSGEVYISEHNNRFNLIHTLTAKGQPNKKLAPASGSDVTLEYVDGYAYASATVQNEGDAACWVFNNPKGTSNFGHKVKLTVTRQGDKYILNVDDKYAVGGAKIYIIGQSNYWSIDDDSMPLRLTDKGGYYGCYTFPEGENYFRFYTELGDWGNDGQLPSVGTYPDDGNWYDVNFTGYYSGPCTPGKGCWVINSTGEPIYFYVNLSTWQVIFSTSPIEEAGNILSEEDLTRNPVKDGLFMSVDGGDKVELKATADGVYTYTPDYIYAGTHTFRFFTRLLPVAAAEPEWAGAYTAGLKGEGVADFTDANHAEFDLEISNETGTVPATPLTLILDDDVAYHQGQIVVDLNKKKLYVADFERDIIVCTGEELPSATNAAEFTDRLLREHGGIVNIPAGKFDISFYRPGYAVTTDAVEYISFAADPFIYADNGSMFGWQHTRLVADDWHGGPVFLNSAMAYDLSKLSSISAITWNGTENVATTMAETAPGSMIYKGTVTFSAPGNDRGYPESHTLYFLLAEKEATVTYPYGEVNNRFEIILGSGCLLYNGAGGYSNAEKKNIGFFDRKAASPVHFNGTPFNLINVAGDAKAEITLDLNTMTLTATLLEGDVATGFETVGNASSALDGATSYSNLAVPATSFIDVPELPARTGGYDFNLATDRNTVIVPASGVSTVVTFDATGTWKGGYNEIPSVAAANAPTGLSRAVLRNAASQQAQWHFDVPENDFTCLAIAVDESNKTITIHSMAHNKGFFTVVNSKYPRVDKISEARDMMLMPSETEGVYVAHIELTEPTGQWSTLGFISQPLPKLNAPYGIMPDFYSPDGGNIDATAADPAIVPAWHQYHVNGGLKRTPFSNFGLTAQPGKYEIIYDSRENTLSMSTNITGIDDVTTDGFAAEGITLIPGAGCVTVTASVATRVDFFAVSGVLVKSVEVPAGTTTVTIAPGFYITAGEKIVVR